MDFSRASTARISKARRIGPPHSRRSNHVTVRVEDLHALVVEDLRGEDAALVDGHDECRTAYVRMSSSPKKSGVPGETKVRAIIVAT